VTYDDDTPVDITMYRSLCKEFEQVPEGQGFGKKDIHPLKMVDEFRFRQMLVPNSYAAKLCVAWMHDTFKKIGDHNPTRKEIHLDYALLMVAPPISIT
jgi:hypothetical protein